MSGIPSVGLYRTENHRYFRDGAGPYPGVTTVLRAIDKPAIVQWAKNETARCAIDNYDFVADLLKRGGAPAAIKWLAGIPDFQRDTAADIGSAVHRLAEDISRGRLKRDQVPPEQMPYVEAYEQFLADYQPDFKSYERMVFSDRGYGGTFDWLAKIDGVTTLGDTKTSKAVYRETALQLAALRYADHIGLPNEAKRWPMPKVDRCAVLHLRPELYAAGYRLIEYRAGPDEYAAFLAALTITQWQATASPIGESVPIAAKDTVVEPKRIWPQMPAQVDGLHYDSSEQ